MLFLVVFWQHHQTLARRTALARLLPHPEGSRDHKLSSHFKRQRKVHRLEKGSSSKARIAMPMIEEVFSHPHQPLKNTLICGLACFAIQDVAASGSQRVQPSALPWKILLAKRAGRFVPLHATESCRAHSRLSKHMKPLASVSHPPCFRTQILGMLHILAWPRADPSSRTH